MRQGHRTKGSPRTCVHLLGYERGNQGGDAGGSQLNSRGAEMLESEGKQMSLLQSKVPGACMYITRIFKERFLSGSLQHSLTCQVQNLIPYSQLSLLFNLMRIYHLKKVFMGMINILKPLESQGNFKTPLFLGCFCFRFL